MARIASFKFGLHVVDLATSPTCVDVHFRNAAGRLLVAGDATEARRFGRALIRAAESSQRKAKRTRKPHTPRPRRTGDDMSTASRPRGQSHRARRNFLVNAVGVAYWSGFRAALRKAQLGEEQEKRHAEVEAAQAAAVAEADRRGML